VNTSGARVERGNVPEFSQNRRGNGHPVVSVGYRDIVSGKPKRIARDTEEHGFSDLQGGGRRFEACSAHPKPHVKAEVNQNRWVARPAE
jgi:hypothetical protein